MAEVIYGSKKQEVNPGSIKVIYRQLRKDLEMPGGLIKPLAYVDGKRVWFHAGNVRNGQRLEFIRRGGSKG